MIIGFDSVKYQRGSRKCVMTASYNSSFTKFSTEEEIQEANVVVAPVGILLRKCLDSFKAKCNGMLPNFILLYRSGVSEREKDVIFTHEVQAAVNLLSGEIQRECYQEGKSIKLNYMLLNKLIESKFFEINNNNINNPKEGTIVDVSATSPENYEFFIQPQFVNQGTATPTHIQSLYDDTGLPIEIVETATYNMCYYYWNWSGAIREPAALKFAEVANKFSSTNMKGFAHDKLKDYPYYI
jgi:aubergine-like protein